MEKISKLPNFKKMEVKLIDIEAKIKSVRQEIEQLQEDEGQLLKFRSKLPHLSAQLTLSREKNQDELREEAHKLGLAELPGREHEQEFERKTGIKLKKVDEQQLKEYIQEAEDEKEKL